MTTQPTEEAMNEHQIKHMANRFLAWKLPESFNPDGGIRFKRLSSEGMLNPMPVGTNLFDATQAEAMVRYMLEGVSAQPTEEAGEPHERWVQIDSNDIWVGDKNGITRKIAHFLNPDDVPPIVAAHNALSSRSKPDMARDGWQDIATAPKNGTPIVTYSEGLVGMSRWSPKFGPFYGDASTGWYSDILDRRINPTHWQPLPAPPAIPAASAEEKK